MHPSVVRDRLIVAQQNIVTISEELAELLGINGLNPIPVDARDENERVMHRYESVVEFMQRAVVAAEESDEMVASERRTVVGDTPPVEIGDPVEETPKEPEVVEGTEEQTEEVEEEDIEEGEEVEGETEEGDTELDEEEKTEIDALNLTHLAKTALYDAGIKTIDQVRAMSDEDLKSISGVGAKTIEVLREAAG